MKTGARIHAVLYFSIGLAVAGCQTYPYSSRDILDAPDILQVLHESAESRSPKSFEAVHRTLLTVRGRQFNLDGYLRVDTETGYHFLVTSGMGSAVFELSCAVGGEVTVDRTSGLIDDATLLAGPGVDILRMYPTNPVSLTTLYSHSADTYALLTASDDEQTIHHLFDKTTLNLVAYHSLRKGRVRYSIEYSDFSKELLDDFTIPTTIRIENSQLGYRLDIRLIDIRVDR
ncbi:MAG: hypothetical protein VCD00_20310 [Candidatus Hydrogenedentota bacterium]